MDQQETKSGTVGAVTQPLLKVGQAFALNIAPGASTQVNANGTNAYLIVATQQVNLRARRKTSVQAYSLYAQGTGFEETEFSSVEVQNPNATSVNVLLWVGTSNFIDKRLILNTQTIQQVACPTYQTASSAAAVAFNDLSGGSFTDINDKKWLAISRISIIICNVDSGVTLLLQKAGSAVANGPAVAAIYPLTSLNYPASGNYSLSVGGGNINAIASEIYLAFPA